MIVWHYIHFTLLDPSVKRTLNFHIPNPVKWFIPSDDTVQPSRTGAASGNLNQWGLGIESNVKVGNHEARRPTTCEHLHDNLLRSVIGPWMPGLLRTQGITSGKSTHHPGLGLRVILDSLRWDAAAVVQVWRAGVACGSITDELPEREKSYFKYFSDYKSHLIKPLNGQIWPKKPFIHRHVRFTPRNIWPFLKVS